MLLKSLHTCVLVSLVSLWPCEAKDIETLSNHFNDPGGSTAPWQFLPSENVKLTNTTETPGLLVLQEAGQGQDVKGVLPHPIRIDDYPMPWYFQLGLMQNQDAVAGTTRSRSQINYAIGLNVALTFSDPKTWPKDRSQRPADTHDMQLLVVHLGASGEVTRGLPQYTDDQHPETFLVWGRGDLGYSAMGNWNIPYHEIGNGMKAFGPASSQVYFQCRVEGPTRVGVGIKFDPTHDYHMRWLDFSQMYGAATGVWEIGPIFSCDRWIPDVLCRSIGLVRNPNGILFGVNPGTHKPEWITQPHPQPETPLPELKYLVDFCVFGSFAGKNLSAFSSDFDIPGYLGKGRFQLYSAKMDTYSYPGFLTLTKMGRTIECFAWATPGEMSFEDFPPPWEIEACVIPPDDAYNWDVDIGFAFMDPQRKTLGYWYPGVRNLPRSGHREYADIHGSPKLFPIVFDQPAMRDALGGERIYMLFQFLERDKVRVGFRCQPEDPWTFSEVSHYDGSLGGPIQTTYFIAWNASSGQPPAGELVGFPMYQQFRFDYFHYRYGTTENN